MKKKHDAEIKRKESENKIELQELTKKNEELVEAKKIDNDKLQNIV